MAQVVVFALGGIAAGHATTGEWHVSRLRAAFGDLATSWHLQGAVCRARASFRRSLVSQGHRVDEDSQITETGSTCSRCARAHFSRGGEHGARISVVVRGC